jgi:hypothetical protein
MLFRQLVADLVEALARVAVALVRDPRVQHPERHLLAVDLGHELGLESRDLLGVLLRQVAEEALAGEAPQLAHALVAVDGLSGVGSTEPPRSGGAGFAGAGVESLAERLCAVERGQIGVPLVDGRELERVLEPGEVLVVLVQQLGDEAVGARAERVDVGCGSPRRHGL